jgi:hypothetical protein
MVYGEKGARNVHGAKFVSMELLNTYVNYVVDGAFVSMQSGRVSAKNVGAPTGVLMINCDIYAGNVAEAAFVLMVYGELCVKSVGAAVFVIMAYYGPDVKIVANLETLFRKYMIIMIGFFFLRVMVMVIVKRMIYQD